MKLTAPLLAGCAALLLGAPAALAADEDPSPAHVVEMIDSYLEIHDALFVDDFEGAKTGARHLLMVSMTGHTPAAVLSEAKAVIAAPDIHQARLHFEQISTVLVELAESIGYNGEHNLYVAHCPMLHGGEGGVWLQDGDAVQNPFHGDHMPTCGTIDRHVPKSAN